VIHIGLRPALGLAAALALGSIPAFAQPSPNEFKGIVTAASNRSLELQLSRGFTTVPLNAQTRVIRTVAGSMADVHPGLMVFIRLSPATGNILSLRIPPVSSSVLAHQLMQLDEDEFLEHPHRTGGAPQHTNLNRYGRVTATGQSSISLRDKRGHVTTYTVDNTVTVTKLMNGYRGDIQIGQLVRADMTEGGSANVVTILKC
jgi:hypothetical protein